MKKIFLLFLIIFLLPTCSLSADSLLSASNKALNYLREKQDLEGKIENLGVSSWAIMAFSAASVDPNSIKRGNISLVDYLKNNSSLDQNKATDLERHILALILANQNPYNSGGIDFVAKLKGLYNNSQIGSPYLLNDDIFGILALISAGEDPNSKIILDSISYLLKNQKPDGSFSYHINGKGDVDDTAAAIQALVATQGKGYQGQINLNSARNYLKNIQNSDGGFPFVTGQDSNSASTSWAVQAICGLGENPLDWQKGGKSPFDFLLSLQNDDGSFNWSFGESSSSLLTTYAILALNKKPLPIKYFLGSSPIPQDSSKFSNPNPNFNPKSSKPTSQTPLSKPKQMSNNSSSIKTQNKEITFSANLKLPFFVQDTLTRKDHNNSNPKDPQPGSLIENLLNKPFFVILGALFLFTFGFNLTYFSLMFYSLMREKFILSKSRKGYHKNSRQR